MRDLFLQCACVCTYVYTCRSHSGMSICTHMHAYELMCHMHRHARMHDGGRGRTALLDNGGWGGQRENNKVNVQ